MKHSTLLATLLAMSLSLEIGCGLEDSAQIKARNLQTGAIETFAADEKIPQGYMVCPDDACAISTQVACEALGGEVCELNPECRIKVLWCTGGSETIPGASGGSSDGSTPGAGASEADPAGNERSADSPSAPTESCEVVCLPKSRLLCEELSDSQACQARSDCEWAQAICPTCMISSDRPSTACECPSSCQTKPQAICQDLDQQTCNARPDCQWDQVDCPPCATGAPCACPSGSCRPGKSPVCPPVNLASPVCENGIEPRPVYDSTGCLIDFICDPSPNCPPVAMPAIVCANGAALAPVYDPTSNCIVRWECPPNTSPPSCMRTGCSGQVCSNQETPTDCLWTEYYKCYDLAICDVTPDGTCGWIDTPEFVNCMKNTK